MLKIRIAATTAALLMAIGNAAAQSTMSPAPVESMRSDYSAAPVSAKTAKKAVRPHRLSAAKSAHRAAKAATTPLPAKAPPARDVAAASAKTAPTENVWPAVDAVAAPAAAPPAPPSSQFAIGAETVPVTPPDELKEVDGAAAGRADFITTEVHQATQASAEAQAMIAAPTQHRASAVGSTSWIAQVLAALGGAVTAAAVAWFLIGPAPLRTET